MFVSVLLYLILFLLPWQTRWIITQGQINNGLSEYSTMSLYGLDMLIIITTLIFLFSPLRKNVQIGNWKKNLMLYIFLAYIFILTPFSLSPILSSTKVITILLGLLLMFLLYYSDIKPRSAVLAFISGASLSGLLGLWQFINQTTFASKWLGLAFHEAGSLGTSVIETTAPDSLIERWLRAYGSLDHPNMFGGLMAITLLLSFWLWLTRGGLEKKWHSAFLISSLIISSAGLMLSFSRTAWISAILGIVTLIISYRPLEKKKWLEVAMAVIIIVAIKGLILSQYYYIFKPRFETNTRLEQISLAERTSSFDDGRELIKKAPWYGFGVGTYTQALHDKLDAKKLSWYYQPVHNVFLLLAIEMGVLGLLLTLLLIGRFLFSIFCAATRADKPLVIALLLALISFATFDHWLVSLHFGLIFLMTILGLLRIIAKKPILTE